MALPFPSLGPLRVHFPGYESGLRCDTAIAYSAAFFTWKFCLGSVGTASELKTVRLGLN